MNRKITIGDHVSLFQKQQTTDFIIAKAEIISINDQSAIIKDTETGKTLSAPLSTLSLIDTMNKNNEYFNFYNFLEENGYQKETIRNANGTTFCTNYQKELSENIWNSLTVQKDKTITGASPKSGLAFKQRPQPTSVEEAVDLMKLIEELPDEEKEH